MPLDSTQLKMDEVKRTFLFAKAHPYGCASLLYHEWGQETPTLFDPMTIAYLLKPELMPGKAECDSSRRKRLHRGRSRCSKRFKFCLDSNSEDFFRFYLKKGWGQ